MAQVLLFSSLCDASKNARSPFLKSEAFRFLSILVAKKASNTESASEMETAGSKAMLDHCESFVQSLVAALQDAEMRKTKRVRDILKTCEKLVEFVETNAAIRVKNLKTLGDEIVSLKVDTESQAVAGICGPLNTKLENLIAKQQEVVQPKATTPTNSSKKKKGKKKGKRR